MAGAHRLTKREVAELTGVSERWVGEQYQPVEHEKRAGRPSPRYDLATLPVEAQQKWAARHRVVEMPAPAAESGAQLALTLTMPIGPNLAEADRLEAERRFGVIEPLIAPERYYLLVRSYPRKGDLVAYLATTHDVAPRTIYHWCSAWKEGGLPALVSRDRSDKGLPRALNRAALDWLLAAALPRKGAYGTLTVREIYRAYGEERAWRAAHQNATIGEFERRKYSRYLTADGRMAPEAQLPEASYETFRTWFQRIPEIARVMAREGEEAFHNSQEIISFRDIGAVSPMDYVVMDHRRLDIFCMAPERGGWKLIRPWLTVAIDMRTRKWLGWAIVESPSSDSIAAVLKRVFLDFGLPSGLYWDNGKDFTCEYFEGKSTKYRVAEPVKEMEPAWRGVLGTLGIRVHHAIVRRARSKIIEPNFTRVSGFDKTLPEYCGHKPTARPERFAGLLDEHAAWERGERETTPFRTIGEVAALYSDALEVLNERELQGEGMQKATPTGRGWRCPNEAWEVLIGSVPRRAVPAEVLQFAFNRRREITVQHGEIRATFAGRHYHYRMANPAALMALNGVRIQIAYDPMDLGEVAVYQQDRFLGLAHSAELRRMGEDQFVEDEKLRRRARRETKKFITAVHAAVPVADPVERLARRQAVTPVRMDPARAIAAAPVAPAVVAAAAAHQAEGEFQFAATAATIEVREVEAPSDEGEFTFF